MWLVNRIFCYFLFGSVSFTALAQNIDSHQYQRVKSRPDLLANNKLGPGLRFAPLHLISYVPALQFGIEYPVSDRLYLQNEFGWVFPGHLGVSWYDTPDFQQIRGLKSRFEVKYFVRNYFASSFYFSIELLQNHLNYDRERTFPVNVTGIPGVDFYQRKEYTLTKNVWGSHFKIGWELPIRDRLFIDLFMGIGLRKVIVTNNLPAYLQNELPRNQGFLWNPLNSGEELRPSAALGVTLIHRLNKTQSQL